MVLSGNTLDRVVSKCLLKRWLLARDVNEESEEVMWISEARTNFSMYFMTTGEPRPKDPGYEIMSSRKANLTVL